MNGQLSEKSGIVGRLDFSGVGVDVASNGGDNTDWDMVKNGSIVLLGGTLSTVGGIAATSTGVGAPAGIVGITLGIPAMGFGGAMIIDGFNGGNRNVPTGPLNAIDRGFGGDGNIGGTLDIFLGGLPKNVVSGVMMGYGIYNSGLFSNLGINSGIPSLFPSVKVDNTNVVMPIINY